MEEGTIVYLFDDPVGLSVYIPIIMDAEARSKKFQYAAKMWYVLSGHYTNGWTMHEHECKVVCDIGRRLGVFLV
jgi:hypothetical protein